ncbi:hypothetical protein PTSG_00818 [Salpingoeca rosetta]|uniref:Uncharacterized protein n=1 Tax=Salpingoeca rosetta (strain ATCC 50818 / BSB-021) TaxID=946362 RepID=F2TXK2_SALR5|nr:uncharacterized protein PTSG_00818 [Salpingoeca rosetta]EGD76111.1 hypothetical protein PTSG_00818 [Salpingoeca rosetta]|eukprot:XP_004998286.1 hypothetical protein PTSG_00818 [Salpingoeca rosetta]
MSRVVPLLVASDSNGKDGRDGAAGAGAGVIRGARGEELRVQFVEDHIVRVTLCPDGKRRVDRSWIIDPTHDPTTRTTTTTNDDDDDAEKPCSQSVATGFLDEGHPGAEFLRVHGSRRDDLFSGSSEAVNVVCENQKGSGWSMSSSSVRVSATAKPGEPPALAWHFKDALVARDLPSSPYTYDRGVGHSGGDGDHQGHGSVTHYMERRSAQEEAYFGLGEAAGRINRYGTRVRLDAIDAMGYSCDPTNRQVSGPLYKHCPIVFVNVRSPPADADAAAQQPPLGEEDEEYQRSTTSAMLHKLLDSVEHDDTASPTSPTSVTSPAFSTQEESSDSRQLGASLGWYAMVYDSSARGVMDLGSEISAFRGSYRYTQFEDGDLEYYMIFGQDLKSVVQDVSRLIGRPLMPPRWCLGYLGSTMAYTEAPDAQEQLKKFVSLCHSHDILCDGFHLSSGYTCVDGADGGFGPRCVFNWNARRIPDPHAMFDHFNKAHMRVLPNIKPWLLADSHPEYARAVASGVCVRDPDDPSRPYVGLFWSGGAGTFSRGSYIDFSSKEGFRWWADRCRTQLIQKGARALWNDNNEYEVDDGMLVCGSGMPMSLMRPIQGLLMAMSSMSALLAERPAERPVVVSRSGSLGMQRYCTQTWSGDNRTSWKTLQWNTPMGLSLGLCGWPFNGHDIGAFAGPRPSEELLLRWIQAAIFMPRFSIHSWNSDNTCTEPWSYATSVDVVRACIQQRYLHHPFMYTLHYDAHVSGLPITRPLVLEFPDDRNCWGLPDAKADRHVRDCSSCDFMVGSALLVCPIYIPGTTARQVYLPTACGAKTLWYDVASSTWLAGGRTYTAHCPLSSPLPITYVRDASVICTLASPPSRSTEEISRDGCGGRVFTLYFSQRPGRTCVRHIEDDGISNAGTQFVFTLDVCADEEAVTCSLRVTKRFVSYLPVRTPSPSSSSFALPFDEVTIKLPARDARALVVNTGEGTHTFAGGSGNVPVVVVAMDDAGTQ